MTPIAMSTTRRSSAPRRHWSSSSRPRRTTASASGRGDKDHLLGKGNREAIAGTVASALSFTGVLYLVTDLVFGTWQAIVAAVAFFAFTAWRWWAIAVYRGFRDVRDS